MQNLARSFFLVLFPGLFVYHLAVALTGAPLVLGALWSPANILACLILGGGTLWLLARGKVPWTGLVPVAILGALVAVYAIGHRFFGSGYQAEWRPFEESIKLLIGWGSLFLIGFWLKPADWFTRALLWSWIAMTAATLLLMVGHEYSFIPSEQFDPRVASYHWFSQSYVVTAIALLALHDNERVKLLVLAASLPVAFVLSSRGELLGYLFVGAAWGVYALRDRQFHMLGRASAVTIAACILVAGWGQAMPQIAPERVVAEIGTVPERVTKPRSARVEGGEDQASGETLDDEVGGNRQVELLYDPAEAPSTQIRLWLLEEGWQDIKRSPILGDYAGHMKIDDYFGHYIHNALSAWHNYGLAAFLLYVSLTGAALWAAARRYGADPMWQMTFFVALYTLVLIVAAKPIYWSMPALAWGLYAANISSKRVPPTRKTPSSVSAPLV
jgi:hypothetical protein